MCPPGGETIVTKGKEAAEGGPGNATGVRPMPEPDALTPGLFASALFEDVSPEEVERIIAAGRRQIAGRQHDVVQEDGAGNGGGVAARRAWIVGLQPVGQAGDGVGEAGDAGVARRNDQGLGRAFAEAQQIAGVRVEESMECPA